MGGFGISIHKSRKRKVEPKPEFFLKTVSQIKLRGDLTWRWSPAQILGRGLWSSSQKSLWKNLSSAWNVSVHQTSDLCEYCCAQRCTTRSSTAVQCGTAVSIVVLLLYVQSCSMLMFLSVLSLTSGRCRDSLHAEQKLSREKVYPQPWRRKSRSFQCWDSRVIVNVQFK